MEIVEHTETRRGDPHAALDGEPAGDPLISDTLFDSIARDVSRPLSAIAGAAALLQTADDQRLAQAARQELLEAIEKEADSLMRFVATVLDFAKLESGTNLPWPRDTAVRDAVNAALAEAAPLLHERTLDKQVAASVGSLAIDGAMLRRALHILVEHAAQRSPARSTVSISAARDAEAVRLQVMNEGEGIDPKDIDGYLDQYHLLAPDDRTRSGAGMHLVVARRLIEANGGTLSVANRTDCSGSVFTITFPASIT